MDLNTYDALCDAIDAIHRETWTLQGALYRMHNRDSYIDRKILFGEFFPEIEADRNAREDRAFKEFGWTRREFQKELANRL